MRGCIARLSALLPPSPAFSCSSRRCCAMHSNDAHSIEVCIRYAILSHHPPLTDARLRVQHSLMRCVRCVSHLKWCLCGYATLLVAAASTRRYRFAATIDANRSRSFGGLFALWPAVGWAHARADHLSTFVCASVRESRAWFRNAVWLGGCPSVFIARALISPKVV